MGEGADRGEAFVAVADGEAALACVEDDVSPPQAMSRLLPASPRTAAKQRILRPSMVKHYQPLSCGPVIVGVTYQEGQSASLAAPTEPMASLKASVRPAQRERHG